METNPQGAEQLEVRSVTNLRTGTTRENEDVPRVRVSQRRADQGAGSSEQRLRALEDKVDRLIEEVKRLRRN
jgi:hypothetical protein